MKPLSNHKWVTLVILGVIYSSAYWAARSSHWLVHRTGYYSAPGQGQKLDSHYISQGDFGSPILSPALSSAQAVSVPLLWPAAQLELAFWHFVAPPGSPWQSQPNQSFNTDALNRTG